MNRIVRSIFIVLVLALVSIGSSGCDVLKPKPVTDAYGPIVNNSVELLDAKVATQPALWFDNLRPGEVTHHFKLPVGYETLISFYYQDRRPYSSYKLRPDGERRDQRDPNGTPCDFIAYARGGGSSRSAKPAAELMRLASQGRSLTYEEAERDSFYVQ